MSNIKVNDLIKNNMASYSAYVATQRAIPDVLDGLKPVTRRIIFSMGKEKAIRFTKSANIVGATMKVHPHGSSYGNLVNISQKDRNNIPLVIGKGNFGSFLTDKIEPAAERYTEVKLNEYSIEMLNLTKEYLVDYVKSYDGRELIPENFVTRLPNVLINAQEGIAVGISSKTGSFNETELINAIIKYIETSEETNLYPDFPTGGFIFKDEENVSLINKKGIGSVRLRAKYEIVDNSILVTELPYGVKVEHIIEKTISLINSNKLKEVKKVNDLTGLRGICIEFECIKHCDMNLVVEKLFSMTKLESAYSFHMNVLDKGYPKILGVWSILKRWIEFRKSNIKRELVKELEDIEKQLEKIAAILLIIDELDEVIKIIRFSPDPLSELSEKFDLNEVQAEYILSTQLRNLNQIYLNKQIDKREGLLLNKKRILFNIENEKEIEKLLIDDLKEADKKYGHPRRTQIITINKENAKKLEKKQKEEKEFEKFVVDNTEYKIMVTKDGYLYKAPASLKINDKSFKMKMDDEIIIDKVVKNSDELLIFNKTDCYKIKFSNIDITQTNNYGLYIKNYLEIDSVDGFTLLESNTEKIIALYDSGHLGVMDANSFRSESNRRKLIGGISNVGKLLETFSIEKDKKYTYKIVTDKKTWEYELEKYKGKARGTKGFGAYKPQYKLIKTELIKK